MCACFGAFEYSGNNPADAAAAVVAATALKGDVLVAVAAVSLKPTSAAAPHFDIARAGAAVAVPESVGLPMASHAAVLAENIVDRTSQGSAALSTVALIVAAPAAVADAADLFAAADYAIEGHSVSPGDHQTLEVMADLAGTATQRPS